MQGTTVHLQHASARNVDVAAGAGHVHVRVFQQELTTRINVNITIIRTGQGIAQSLIPGHERAIYGQRIVTGIADVPALCQSHGRPTLKRDIATHLVVTGKSFRQSRESCVPKRAGKPHVLLFLTGCIPEERVEQGLHIATEVHQADGLCSSQGHTVLPGVHIRRAVHIKRGAGHTIQQGGSVCFDVGRGGHIRQAQRTAGRNIRTSRAPLHVQRTTSKHAHASIRPNVQRGILQIHLTSVTNIQVSSVSCRGQQVAYLIVFSIQRAIDIEAIPLHVDAHSIFHGNSLIRCHGNIRHQSVITGKRLRQGRESA